MSWHNLRTIHGLIATEWKLSFIDNMPIFRLMGLGDFYKLSTIEREAAAMLPIQQGMLGKEIFVGLPPFRSLSDPQPYDDGIIALPSQMPVPSDLEELEPQPRDFQGHIKAIERKMLSTLPSTELQHVEETGWFFDHKVTGEELNQITCQIQEALISTNETFTGIHEEFQAIYHTFNFLDREYMEGIRQSIAAAQEASQQALKAAEDGQATLKKLVQTVKKLQQFKTQTDQRLDELTKRTEELSQHATATSNRVENLENASIKSELSSQATMSIQKGPAVNAALKPLTRRIGVVAWTASVAIIIAVTELILLLCGIL